MREIVEETDVNKAHVVAEWPRLADEDGYLLVCFMLLETHFSTNLISFDVD